MTFRGARASPRGMTLLELATVLAIVAVMVGISAATLDRVRLQGQVNGETRHLLTALRNARTLAVTTGRIHGVYVGGPADTENNGGGGSSDFRNRLVLFAKPRGATTTIYESTDRVVRQTPMPYRDRVDNAILAFSPIDGSPGASYQVTFDPEGRPTVSVRNAGVTVPQPFPVGPSPRQIVELWNPFEGPRPTNNTRRCLELSVTGDAKILEGCP